MPRARQPDETSRLTGTKRCRRRVQTTKATGQTTHLRRASSQRQDRVDTGEQGRAQYVEAGAHDACNRDSNNYRESADSFGHYSSMAENESKDSDGWICRRSRMAHKY